MEQRWWRRATLTTVAGAATLMMTALCLDAGAASAGAPSAARGPLPLPTLLPLPSPSLPVSLPPIEPPKVTLPPLEPPPVKLPTLPPATASPGPTAPPATTPPTGGTPPQVGVPGRSDSGGSMVDPGSAPALIAGDPGADLYPQPPVDATGTPQARQVAALGDVQHRIQYLENTLARTRADLAKVRRGPDPVLHLLTTLTAGGDTDAASPLTVADAADVADTPTGRAVALSGAITAGQTELVRRRQEEKRLRQEIDRRVRALPAAPAVAAPARTVATVGRGRLGRPLAGRLTSRFGTRFDPYYRVWQLHPGVDLAAPTGTPILAAADGRVSRVGWYGGYGNYTCIAHGRADGQRLSTCYGHQSRLLVSPGQRVRAGQVIGLVGSTGASTGPHLHFEVRLGGRPVDPLPWL